MKCFWLKYRHFFYQQALALISFFVVAERGFMSLLPINNTTFRVRSGDSLSLTVNIKAYPKPHTFSWSFDELKMRNTTDHTISTYQNDYRWEHKHHYVLPHLEGEVHDLGTKECSTFGQDAGHATVRETAGENNLTLASLVKQSQTDYRWLLTSTENSIMACLGVAKKKQYSC